MAYQHTLDHLLDELACLDLLIRGLADDRHDSRNDEPIDLSAQLGESPATGQPEPQLVIPSSLQDDLARHRDRIERERNVAHENDITLRLDTLATAFDLDRQHLDILLLALLPDVDPSAGSVFETLHDDVGESRPTVGLVSELYSTSAAEFLAATELFGHRSPLREYGLVVLSPPENAPDPGLKLDHSLRVDDRIYSFLLGQEGIDPALRSPVTGDATETVSGYLTEVSADTALDALLVNDDTYNTLSSLRDTDETGRRFYFYGPPGSGPRRATEAICGSDTCIQINLPDVLEAGMLDAVVREAALQARPVIVSGADAVTDSDRSLSAIVTRFEPVVADIVFVGESEWTPSGTDRQTVDAIVAFDRPAIPLRRQYWQSHADVLPDELDPERMASTFDLTLGQMENAMATARTLAGDEELTVAHIRTACRAQSSSDLSELAQHVTPDVDREQVILREQTETKLDQLQAHITNRGHIYDDWGFRQKEDNAGVVALFKGKPGTGKTMAAEALANEVGMHIYKIDLSSVVSKYIGETEENLEQIFQAAEQSNAILLFDEADSVFGDRAEVSDATDRYANAEVNYLLQRIETYDGIILLTTNYASNIDDAFMRRINHIVRFETPQESTREAIWSSAFPDDTPTEDIDAEWLAQFDFSGGEIASLAKRIAVEAASCGAERIRMKHAVRVLERDYRDAGRVVRKSEFEPYTDALAEPPQESGDRRTRR
jgi:AAA+ superfamily predicted ATPase